MLTVTVFVFLLIVFDIAAMRWGFTSSDGPESREWERRQQRAWPEERASECSARRRAGWAALVAYGRRAARIRRVQPSLPEMSPLCQNRFSPRVSVKVLHSSRVMNVTAPSYPDLLVHNELILAKL